MDTVKLSIRIDKDVKESAEKLFSEMGLTMSAAVNIFLRQAIREHALPFRVTLDPPFNTTLLSIAEESLRIACDKNTEGCHSIDDRKASLDI